MTKKVRFSPSGPLHGIETILVTNVTIPEIDTTTQHVTVAVPAAEVGDVAKASIVQTNEVNLAMLASSKVSTAGVVSLGFLAPAGTALTFTRDIVIGLIKG